MKKCTSASIGFMLAGGSLARDVRPPLNATVPRNRALPKPGKPPRTGSTGTAKPTNVAALCNKKSKSK